MTIIQRRRMVRYGTSTIDYLLAKSKRAKTSEILVEKESYSKKPFDKPLYEIEKIVQNKAYWILKKQREYKEKPPQLIRPTFKSGSTLPILGKNYPLKIK